MASLRSRWLLAAALGAAGLGLAVAADMPDYLNVQDSWMYMIDGPRLDLDRARVELRRGRPRLAAADVRRAAALVGDEAQRAGGADQARQETEAARRLLAAASRMVEGFGAHLATRTGNAVESEWTRARDTVHAALGDLSMRLGLPHVG